MPEVAQVKRPLREPSGQRPSASKAISVWRAPEQCGIQPQTWGTVSPRGGAAPWLRAVQRKIVPAGQVFHAGDDAGAGGSGPAGWTSRPAMLGGGAVPPEMN